MEQKIKVLLVDDDPDMLTVMALRLTKAGYEIKKAATGNEALDSVTSFTPHIILLDFHLPDISGEEVEKKIHAMDNFKTIPIIFFSGTLSTEELPSGPHIKALIKPCPFEKLNATIKEMLP